MRNKLVVALVAVMMMFAITEMVYANGNNPPVIEGPQGIPGVDGRDGKDAEVRRNPAGLGVDAVLWQTENENIGVETQYKYDIQNDEHSIYGVMKLNAWKIIKR